MKRLHLYPSLYTSISMSNRYYILLQGQTQPDTMRQEDRENDMTELKTNVSGIITVKSK